MSAPSFRGASAARRVSHDLRPIGPQDRSHPRSSRSRGDGFEVPRDPKVVREPRARRGGRQRRSLRGASRGCRRAIARRDGGLLQRRFARPRRLRGAGFRSTLPAATSDKNYQWRRTSWLLCGVVDVQVLVRAWAVEEVNRARWGYTAIPARKGESHRYADQRPARQAARFQHDRYRSAESLARKLYRITKDIPADLEGTAPAPPDR